MATVSPTSLTFDVVRRRQDDDGDAGCAGTATITRQPDVEHHGRHVQLRAGDVHGQRRAAGEHGTDGEVAGVTGGASYDKGSVPVATCHVTDAEDGNSTFAARR